MQCAQTICSSLFAVTMILLLVEHRRKWFCLFFIIFFLHPLTRITHHVVTTRPFRRRYRENLLICIAYYTHTLCTCTGCFSGSDVDLFLKSILITYGGKKVFIRKDTRLHAVLYVCDIRYAEVNTFFTDKSLKYLPDVSERSPLGLENSKPFFTNCVIRIFQSPHGLSSYVRDLRCPKRKTVTH